MSDQPREYGIEWVWSDGTVRVGGVMSELAARGMVSRCRGKGWDPVAARVMRRTVGEWEPA